MKAIATIMSLGATVTALDNNLIDFQFYVPVADPPSGATVSNGASNYKQIFVGGGQVANQMPGWPDAETAGSRFFDIPESQMLNYAYIPSWNIQAGSYMTFLCAPHPLIKKCDIFVNLYKCSDCEAGLNQDFSDYLITDGWTPSKCGPKFISDAGEESHKFITYRKQVDPSLQRYDVFIDSNVKLMFVTMNSNGVDCSDYAPSKCETSGYQQCKLIKGECVDNWCPRTFQGPIQPPPGNGMGGGMGCQAPPCVSCNNCALKEAAFQ